MDTRTHSHSRKPLLLIGALALLAACAIAGCNGAGQSQVTETDRPSEGEGWAVQEDMAR
ncbi:MAG: lipoprotein [Phycisphaerae bacterium]|nr:lipoprotein [Phycisphaerae bacterium]MBN8598503.1 lipoprotein [Planctomycetota bacterium]